MLTTIQRWFDEGKISYSAYLIRLLDSIRNQGYKSYEVIIVDDASNDDTEQTVNQYRSMFLIDDKKL